MKTYTDRFFQRGREFLQVDTPIMCGAMTWVSDPQLVAAVANAGGFGCLAGGNTPVDILEQQIRETRQRSIRAMLGIVVVLVRRRHDSTRLDPVRRPPEACDEQYRRAGQK